MGIFSPKHDSLPCQNIGRHSQRSIQDSLLIRKTILGCWKFSQSPIRWRPQLANLVACDCVGLDKLWLARWNLHPARHARLRTVHNVVVMALAPSLCPLGRTPTMYLCCATVLTSNLQLSDMEMYLAWPCLSPTSRQQANPSEPPNETIYT